jgi:hypothetical protein
VVGQDSGEFRVKKVGGALEVKTSMEVVAPPKMGRIRE